jgi:hypothetical protein
MSYLNFGALSMSCNCDIISEDNATVRMSDIGNRKRYHSRDIRYMKSCVRKRA